MQTNGHNQTVQKLVKRLIIAFDAIEAKAWIAARDRELTDTSPGTHIAGDLWIRGATKIQKDSFPQ